MSFCFRRLYATLPKSPEATTITPTSVLSSPLQVRRRRQRKASSPVAPETPTSPLSPSEQARYQRLQRLGAFLKEENDFQEPTEEEWLTELNARRTRIRGAVERVVNDPETGATRTVEDVVGQRIYLPNIIFRMMRNYTPPGQPYNPWEATFRVPNSVTKLDIRSYLFAAYGVKCTYIRTDNYFAPIWRAKLKDRMIRIGNRQRTRKSYKRAVVGLVEPFYYPEALEDMDLAERQERGKWLNEKFHTEQARETNARKSIGTLQPPKWFNMSGNRGAILRNIMARRMERERSIEEEANKFSEPQQELVTEDAMITSYRS